MRAVLDGLKGKPGRGWWWPSFFRRWFPGTAPGWRTSPNGRSRISRVEVAEGDVAELLARSAGAFDLILLDVDNGPEAFTLDENHELYTDAGIAAWRPGAATARGGAIWSACDDHGFAHRLHPRQIRGRGPPRLGAARRQGWPARDFPRRFALTRLLQSFEEKARPPAGAGSSGTSPGEASRTKAWLRRCGGAAAG